MLSLNWLINSMELLLLLERSFTQLIHCTHSPWKTCILIGLYRNGTKHNAISHTYHCTISRFKRNMRHLILLSLLFIFCTFPCRHAVMSRHQLCHHDEMNALLQFKNTLIIVEIASMFCDHAFPKTKSWNKKSGNNSDCCLWDGVACDKETGHVIELDLSCSLLNGTISSNTSDSLFHLTHLRRLNLAYNYFHGSHISPAFGRFTDLTHLDLSRSKFVGSIPRELSLLSKLVSIDVSGNSLSVESNDFDSLLKNLTRLKELVFQDVQISSNIPNSLMNLSSLERVDLAFCGLDGILPGQIFMLPNLRELELGVNNLKGDIPEISSTNTSSLQIISMNGNRLFGQRGLPDSVGNLKSLRELDLSFTDLAGELPDSIGSLESLIALPLEYCNLYGSIPKSFGNLTKLTHLDLSYNKLYGSIPKSFGNLTQLTYLSLSENSLSGSIPITISNLKKLKALYLDNNRLIGTLPPWLFTFPSLSILYMGSNKLTGPIPDFQNESPFEYIYLNNNNLQGSVPHSVVNLVNLTYLSLSSNRLNGTIEPLLFSKLGNLRVLDLSRNILQGSFPVLPVSLSTLLTSHNNLSGDIPSSICKLTNLQILDVSYNDFGGKIPQCLMNYIYLEVLDLQKNRFSGTIPPISAKLLKTLNLNDNHFEGPIPESLSNCKELELLDLGKNKLNGSFPHWLETFSELQVLVLRSNHFQGHVGTSKTKSPYHKLRIFDLSDNEFTGFLPARYFQNFTAMKNSKETEGGPTYMESNFTYRESYQLSIALVWNGVEVDFVRILTTLATIDLSANNFVGHIPEALQVLNSLRMLNLSHNSLTGPIPVSLGNLSNLQILDLSSNKLTGTIPFQLASITTLAKLNVSYNHLVGPIPHGNQFNSFENNSYIDNSGLCGFPLSHLCGDYKKPQSPKVKRQKEDQSIFSSGFTWKIVLLGYGCGVPFGLISGFLMFYVGWPRWFTGILEPQNGRPRRRRNRT